MSRNGMADAEIWFVSKGGFNCIIMPVTLEVAFRCLEIYSVFKFYIPVLMACYSIMQQLLRHNAQCKEQKHQSC